MKLLSPFKAMYAPFTSAVTVDDITFDHTYLHCTGEEKGTIVCLPGILGFPPYFYPLDIPEIRTNYNIIIPDNIGFSIKQPTVESFYAYFEKYVNYLIHRELLRGDLVVVGNSLGVIIGKLLELRRGGVAKQIWIGCSGLSDHYEYQFLAQKNKRSGSSKRLSRDFLHQVKTVGQLSAHWWSIPLSWILFYRQKVKTDKQLIMRLMKLGIDTKRFDFAGRLDQIRSEVCIIHGDKDKIVSSDCVRTYQKGLVNVRRLDTHILPHAGHIVLGEWRQTKKVQQIIQSFLG